MEDSRIPQTTAESSKTMTNPEAVPCSLCETDSTAATVGCQDCELPMCDACSRVHSKTPISKDHRVVTIVEYFHLPKQKRACKKHVNQMVNLFCNTCCQAICSVCDVVRHKEHRVYDLDDFCEQFKRKVNIALDGMRQSAEWSMNYIQNLNEQNLALETMQQSLFQNIAESFDSIVAKLLKIRQQYEDDVRSKIGKQTADRNKWIEKVCQLEKAKAEHTEYCDQSLLLAEPAQLGKLSPALITKAVSLTNMTELHGMVIQEVTVNLDAFLRIDQFIEKTTVTYDIRQLRSCFEVADATRGRNCDVLKITLLPKENSIDTEHVTLQADIQAPGRSKRGVEPAIETVCSVVGTLRYKPDMLGPHRTSIRLNGRHLIDDRVVFHSKEPSDDQMKKKLIFTMVGLPELHHELQLPRIEFDKRRINWKECSIDNYGRLINKPTPNIPFDVALRRLSGVVARTTIKDHGRSYWQVGIHLTMLSWRELELVAVEVGICHDERTDDDVQPANNKNACCIALGSCKIHGAVCLYVYSGTKVLTHIQVAGVQPDLVLDIDLGFLLDCDNSILHVIHVQSCKVVGSIPDVDTSLPLMPVFGLYSPTMFDVQVRVDSGNDLPLDSSLLLLLSHLIQP